jgi:bacterial/archaeal transporter family protein
MWWAYAILSAVFASLTAILAKKGVENIHPDLATAIRTVVILFITWSIVFAKGATSMMQSLTSRTLIFLISSGAATGLSWLFYFKALQVGKVSQVAPVDKLSVALTVILAILLLGEPLTLKTAVGTLLIVGGTIVLIL